MIDLNTPMSSDVYAFLPSARQGVLTMGVIPHQPINARDTAQDPDLTRSSLPIQPLQLRTLID